MTKREKFLKEHPDLSQEEIDSLEWICGSYHGDVEFCDEIQRGLGCTGCDFKGEKDCLDRIKLLLDKEE